MPSPGTTAMRCFMSAPSASGSGPGAPHEEVGPPRQESPGGLLGPPRPVPAPPLPPVDGPDWPRAPARPLGGPAIEAGRVAVERGEGAHPDLLEARLEKQPGQPPGEPAVHGAVVGM